MTALATPPRSETPKRPSKSLFSAELLRPR